MTQVDLWTLENELRTPDTDPSADGYRSVLPRSAGAGACKRRRERRNSEKSGRFPKFMHGYCLRNL